MYFVGMRASISSHSGPCLVESSASIHVDTIGGTTIADKVHDWDICVEKHFKLDVGACKTLTTF